MWQSIRLMNPRFVSLLACIKGLSLLDADHVASAQTAWEDPLQGLPLMASYDVPPTRHNAEVWGFARAESGQLWIGSDELFLFNGETRETVALPFETYAVRALTHDASGRLWIGAIGEIGHFERTATSGWSYVSARDDLQAVGVDDVRVWEAHPTPQGVVFVADDQVLRWNGTRFERWPMPSSAWLRATRDRDVLWIVQPGVGVFRMTAEGPRMVLAAADLPDPSIGWILGSRLNDSAPFLVGGTEGVYRRQDNGWTKLERLSTILAGRSPWRIVALDDTTVAIGTALGGVVIGSIDDRVLAVLDRANSLPNDSVASLWLDERNKQLWIGYVGGMSRVDARGGTSVFDMRNGLQDAPALKTVLHRQRTFVLGRGLSQLTPRQDGQAAVARQLFRLPTPLSDALSTRGNHSAKHQNHWRRHASFRCRAGPRVRAVFRKSRGADAGPTDAEWLPLAKTSG